MDNAQGGWSLWAYLFCGGGELCKELKLQGGCRCYGLHNHIEFRDCYFVGFEGSFGSLFNVDSHQKVFINASFGIEESY